MRSMPSNSKSRYALAAVLLTLWASNGVVASSQAVPRTPRAEDSSTVSKRGKQTFASTCAACHGLDGRGGERAPNIVESPKVQRLSNAELVHIIENGISGTGMPAFPHLESSDIKAVITYLRTLQGEKRNGVRRNGNLPGDPKSGEILFFAKAGCASCHMVAGKGGFIASDLSGYGRTHAAEQVRSAISNPALGTDRLARTVTATTNGGEKFIGRIRNQDNFSLQLQTLDSTFHFFAKSDLATLQYSPQTLMPGDYASTLSPDELNDVVNYLMSVSDGSPSQTPEKKLELEEE